MPMLPMVTFGTVSRPRIWIYVALWLGVLLILLGVPLLLEFGKYVSWMQQAPWVFAQTGSALAGALTLVFFTFYILQLGAWRQQQRERSG